jgi:hypothetical protein
MEQVIQLVTQNLLFAAGCVFICVQRQAGNGLSQYSYTGIYCGGLHGRELIDRFAAGGTAKEKAIKSTWKVVVNWLISGLKKPVE